HDLTRLDFVKLDVEGNEERVIRGGYRTLQSCRPMILIEIHPVLLQRMGSSAEAIMTALRDLGYRLYSIDRERLVQLTVTPTDLTNILCLPESGLQR
ncbi:MAG: FkbM family methyltransferase, partial [Verrucomicrobiae bacterium]|nr:FkbM family methyltransferase [Verrucomicrobiae bacterium]